MFLNKTLLNKLPCLRSEIQAQRCWSILKQSKIKIVCKNTSMHVVSDDSVANSRQSFPASLDGTLKKKLVPLSACLVKIHQKLCS